MKEDPKNNNSEIESLMAKIADDFLRQLKQGEQPQIEEYAKLYPDIAGLLRQVLPTLQEIGEAVVETDPISDVSDPDKFPKRTLGDFRIIREIGRGGMGVVYEAEQISLDRRVALKVLPFAAVLDDRRLQRFKTEAKAAAQLHHTNIVPVFSVGCDRGVHYYAMQYVEGHTLSAVIRELRELSGLDTQAPEGREETVTRLAEDMTDGRFEKTKSSDSSDTSGGEGVSSETVSSPIETLGGDHSTKKPSFFRSVATLGIQAAEALECAHAIAIVHRDIKPSNLLLDARGHLWMTDFGLAQFQTDMGMTLTMPGDVLGTLRYMSPEQALGEHTSVDHRTDIYSLGTTLYELLTLEPVFTGKDRPEILRQIADKDPRPLKRLNEAVPTDLETIVLKSMAKEPKSRYATAQEMADDLRRFLDDKPIKARRPTLIARAIKWRRRHRALSTAAIIVLIGTILNLVLLLLLTRTPQAAKGRTIFVNVTATGNNNGWGWTDAFTHLQDALAVAQPGDEIRVAEGIYRPDRNSDNPNGSGDRTISFALKNGVSIRGGYAGPQASQTRDIKLHESILSGDIASDDGPDFANNRENNFHVVTGSGTDETAMLDGFTITGGNADGLSSYDDDLGGGMYSFNGSPTLTNCIFSKNTASYQGAGIVNTYNSNPIMRKCTFTANQVDQYGGGMMNYKSNPTLMNCIFTGNSALNDADGMGGGMYNRSHSEPRLTNCSFIGNWAGRGGAMYNTEFASPTLIKCTLNKNRASDIAGGMYNDNNSNPTLVDCILIGNSSANDAGGMFNLHYSSPKLANCTFIENTTRKVGGGLYNSGYCNSIVRNCSFIGNSATKGGGIANLNSRPVVTNCTFSGNSANENGGGMYSDSSAPMVTNCTFTGNQAIKGGGIHNHNKASSRVTNCILWGNIASSGPQVFNDEISSATVSCCNVQGGYPGTGNISVNPMFVDADGADDIVATMDDDLRLSFGSPCIDVGDNQFLLTDTTDLDADGDIAELIPLDRGAKSRIYNSIVDMGAYEWMPINTPVGEIVKVSAPASRAKISFDSAGADLDAFLESDQGQINEVRLNVHVEQTPAVNAVSAPAKPVQMGTDLAAGTTVSDPNANDTHVTVWDWGNSKFNHPHGVLTDPSGDVYVIDTFIHRIQKLGPAGNFLIKWGTMGKRDGQFYYPHCAAVNNSGNIYVTDTHNHRIQVFDLAGNFIRKWSRTELSNPWGIAIDSNEVVYVTGRWSNNVLKFDSDDNFIAKWGTKGTGDGQFNEPQGVALDSLGNVYIADTFNHRIQKFDTDGNFLAKWGMHGTGDGQFDRPGGLAMDSLDNLYVVDTHNHRVQKFDSNGNFITKWGTEGTGDGQFNRPFGITLDSLGNVYVSDAFNNRVVKFSTVPDPLQLLERLAQDVIALNLQSGISNSLGAKLDVALKAIDNPNKSSHVAAINSLKAFVNIVEDQRSKKIPDADAHALIAVAQGIMDLLMAG